MDVATPPYASAFFEGCLLLAVALPLVSALVCWCISERYSWLSTFLAPLFLLVSAVSAAIVFFMVWNQQPFMISHTWFRLGDLVFTAGIFINNTAAMMLLVVTFISLLVHIYSTGYMAGDAGLRKYFSMLGFFTFSMLGIVLADNLLLIFVFWEMVGFASYMLIGHWQFKPEAASAARKAFIMNRIGDAGFLTGIMILWTATGTLEFVQLTQIPQPFSWQTAAALCLFAGVIGKSAQFPLLTWLPDAMEGPTPVSALIHAATMVAAGVFLLARVDFLFTPVALDVVMIVGTITALMGALSALVQTDIKKILAYSTISQLGFMVMAVGAGSSDIAMLHLFTHAFFKACLFLGAGVIIHVLHQAQHQSHTHFDVQDIRNLGGLKAKMPFTFLAFAVSGSALAGLPFTSGFLSKEAILTVLMGWKGDTFSWRWIVLILAFVITFLTVVYTFRLIWSVFIGPEKQTASLALPEVPGVMRGPVALLLPGAAWLLISLNPMDYQGWLFAGLHPGKHFHFGIMALISAAWVLVALGVSWTFRERLPLLKSDVLLNTFHLDVVYGWLVVKPSAYLAQLTERIDRRWIDGMIHASAYAQVSVAHLTGWFDRAIVDGMVHLTTTAVRTTGSFARSFQGGKIQTYIFWSAFAIIIFLIWTLF